MSWIASLAVGFLTAVAGLLCTGAVATGIVSWYRISSREGQSGYFVVFLALLGALGGSVIGVVVARLLAAGPSPSFLKALAISLGIVVGLLGAVAGVARALADVPPRLAGETLWLRVEVRAPAEQQTSPAEMPGNGTLTLGSAGRLSRTLRTRRSGVLFKEDARLEDGRWIVPGAVSVFTGRGMRMLEIGLPGQPTQWFAVPLPARPGKASLTFSDWLPAGGRSPLTFRIRVQPVSEPLRRQTVGPFEVDTIASDVYESGAEPRGTMMAFSTFVVRHGGKPVVVDAASTPNRNAVTLDRAPAVLAVSAPKPALLVNAGGDGDGETYLLVDDGGILRATFVGRAYGSIELHELTNDPGQFSASKAREPMRGWLDRTSLDHQGIFLVGGEGLLDTRRLTVAPLPRLPDELSQVMGFPPLAVSPDGRSVVRFALRSGSEQTPALAVTDAVDRKTEILPIDRARMRYPRYEKLEPAWVDHHFVWERDGDGVDRLKERSGFTPLPYRGELTLAPGGFSEYKLEPAGEPVRRALLDFLTKELRAEPTPAETGAYSVPVRIDGREVKVNRSGDFGYVSVTLDDPNDVAILETIAKRFDAELATGKHDAAFTPPKA